jgi:hypothetical protein
MAAVIRYTRRCISGGGAPRKREQHHAARISARSNQVGDAVGERVGLAGTCTRDDEERRGFMKITAAVFDGAALLGVERGEVGCGHRGEAIPEMAARPKDRFPGAILRVAPNHSASTKHEHRDLSSKNSVEGPTDLPGSAPSGRRPLVTGNLAGYTRPAIGSATGRIAALALPCSRQAR